MEPFDVPLCPAKSSYWIALDAFLSVVTVILYLDTFLRFWVIFKDYLMQLTLASIFLAVIMFIAFWQGMCNAMRNKIKMTVGSHSIRRCK